MGSRWQKGRNLIPRRTVGTKIQGRRYHAHGALNKHSRWHAVGAPDFRAIKDFPYTVWGDLIRTA